MHRIIMKYLILSLFVICLYSSVYSAEKGKPRVAVMNFSAHNCPEVVASSIKGMVGSKIFEKNIFNMIERTQIDEIMKEMALQQTGCTDSSCIVEVGKMLSADKIIVGDIHRVDEYIIIAKVVNVADGKIESNFKATAADESQFDNAVADISFRISNEYNKGNIIEVSATPGYLYAAGGIGDLFSSSYGIMVHGCVRNMFLQNLVLKAGMGYYYASGNNDAIKSISMIPFSISAGYYLDVHRLISVTPFGGVGFMIYAMNYDSDNADINGNYEYETKAYFDPILLMGVDVRINLYKNISVSIMPGYMIAFEKNAVNHFPGINLGVVMTF